MRYLKIDNFDVCNGEGFGVVLWVSGCDVHCPGCHNPETWDSNVGKLFTEKEEKEILQRLSKPYISRLTLTGGHPLMACNRKDVLSFVQKVKENYPKINIWLYTGYDIESDICKKSTTIQEIFKHCDVIVDGPFVEAKYQKNLAYRGSSNQRIIDIQEYLRTGLIKEIF